MLWKIEEDIIVILEESIKQTDLTPYLFEVSPIYLEVPKSSSHGDFSSTIAMKLSRIVSRSPSEIANLIAIKINEKIKEPLLKNKIEKVEVEPPGFINFFLTRPFLSNVLTEIEKEGVNFGRSNLGKNRKIQIEFVSANPTGPLSVAHGRQAAVGDSLANIIEFSGYKVSKEYYINDEGSRIELLGSSIRSRYLQLLGEAVDFPSDGYKGKYIFNIAKSIIDKYGDKKKSEKFLRFFSTYGYKSILKQIKKDLISFGVSFDSWFSETSLRKSGKIEKTLGILEKKGYIFKEKGAVWFKSSKFGDDKDRVVIRSDGNFTYLAPDIAYHKDKYERGFCRLINLWGPDHHGYIPRIKAAVTALGFEEKILSILVVQLVTLLKKGKPIPMSTREGEYISLREVMEEVGRDAARFFFLMRKKNSHLDFDLELAKRQSLDNPVYYIQYAHARISSILKYNRRSVESFSQSKRTVQKAGKVTNKSINLTLLDKPEELELLKILFRFPKTISLCVENLEPYGLLFYLQELATSFHRFYDKWRVISDDLGLTNDRLVLVNCIRIVLANGLRLLGVSAPKKM